MPPTKPKHARPIAPEGVDTFSEVFSLSVAKPKDRASVSEWRKRQLIIATINCIAKGGIHYATVEEITTLADVSRGLIRYYYKTKSVLIAEAWRYLCNDFRKRVEASSKMPASGPLDIILGIQKLTFRDPHVEDLPVSSWFNFWNAARTDDDLREIYKEFYDWYRVHIEGLFQELAKERKSRIDINHAVDGFIAMTDGFWFEAAIDLQKRSQEDVTDICRAHLNAIFEK